MLLWFSEALFELRFACDSSENQ